MQPSNRLQIVEIEIEMHRFSACGPLIIDGCLDGADPGTAMPILAIRPSVAGFYFWTGLYYVQSDELTNRNLSI
jgi:hypothetical protein